MSFLPDNSSIKCLGALLGRFQILTPTNLIGGPTELIITSSDGGTVRLVADYTDVSYKFECFGIFPESKILCNHEDDYLIHHLDSHCNIMLCLRFEWELEISSTAHHNSPEENPLRQRGKRKDVPDLATAACVSLVGIAFKNEKSNTFILAAFNSDEEPATLQLYNGDEMKNLINECDVVSLSDYSIQLAKLQD
jgi:hypothetical protein